jgi:hypothetical protein
MKYALAYFCFCKALQQRLVRETSPAIFSVRPVLKFRLPNRPNVLDLLLITMLAPSFLPKGFYRLALCRAIEWC